MNLKRHLLEAATLIAAAVLCALIANAVAGRERKMAVVSSYPTAMQVPATTPDVAPALSRRMPEPTTLPAEAPAAGAPAGEPAPRMTSTAPVIPTVPNVKHPLNPAAQQPSNPVIQQPAPQQRSVDTAFPPHPDKPYVELHGDDVAFLHQKGVLFLDARRTSVYEQGHIAGARPVSVWESDVDEKINKLFTERSDPREQALPIVVYCSGGDCEDSHMLAQKLWGIQFNNVYVYKDGFPDWQKRGGAIRTGPTP